MSVVLFFGNLTLKRDTNPNSFLYYKSIGKGNFGEVYLAEKKTFISLGDSIEVGNKLKD